MECLTAAGLEPTDSDDRTAGAHDSLCEGLEDEHFRQYANGSLEDSTVGHCTVKIKKTAIACNYNKPVHYTTSIKPRRRKH